MILSVSVCLFLSFSVQAQTENQPACSHTIKNSNANALIQYLSQQYGYEDTERILLNLRNYEDQNRVIVLFGQDYQLVKSRLETGLSTSKDADIISSLQKKLAQLVNFTDIEAQLIKK